LNNCKMLHLQLAAEKKNTNALEAQKSVVSHAYASCLARVASKRGLYGNAESTSGAKAPAVPEARVGYNRSDLGFRVCECHSMRQHVFSPSFAAMCPICARRSIYMDFKVHEKNSFLNMNDTVMLNAHSFDVELSIQDGVNPCPHQFERHSHRKWDQTITLP